MHEFSSGFIRAFVANSSVPITCKFIVKEPPSSQLQRSHITLAKHSCDLNAILRGLTYFADFAWNPAVYRFLTKAARIQKLGYDEIVV